MLAQTFGWYKTCDCVTSNWAGGGGYLDFSKQDTSNSEWVMYYWTAGASCTGMVLFLSMFYITVEVCMHRATPKCSIMRFTDACDSGANNHSSAPRITRTP